MEEGTDGDPQPSSLPIFQPRTFQASDSARKGCVKFLALDLRRLLSAVFLTPILACCSSTL